MLGLFASALAPNANSAPLLVIILMLPQIVLAGALVPLPTSVSAPTSTRWAFEALMGITGSGSDVARDICWALPPDVRKAMTLEDKKAYGCNCMGVNMLKQKNCNYPGLANSITRRSMNLHRWNLRDSVIRLPNPSSRSARLSPRINQTM